MISPKIDIITVTPTRLAHVIPSPPRSVKSDMTDTAIGLRSEPISVKPMAIAMIVRTTFDTVRFAMIIEFHLSYLY